MVKLLLTLALACLCTIGTTSCSYSQASRCPPASRYVANTRSLACWISTDHVISVGTGGSFPIPKGTQVSFLAKLADGRLYCWTEPTPEVIPPHLSIDIYESFTFDTKGACDAWWSPPLINAPP
jgi:hypothetical protein